MVDTGGLPEWDGSTRPYVLGAHRVNYASVTSPISQTVIRTTLLLTYIEARLGQAELTSGPLKPAEIYQVINGVVTDFAGTLGPQEVRNKGKLKSKRFLPSA